MKNNRREFIIYYVYHNNYYKATAYEADPINKGSYRPFRGWFDIPVTRSAETNLDDPTTGLVNLLKRVSNNYHGDPIVIKIRSNLLESEITRLRNNEFKPHESLLARWTQNDQIRFENVREDDEWLNKALAELYKKSNGSASEQRVKNVPICSASQKSTNPFDDQDDDFYDTYK